jgi:2-keto-4-pentenoate hydratase/2-oxohepta-3-ene-1,7-dioic acid hydratase in catechol pathway
MRLATIVAGGAAAVAVVKGERVLPLQPLETAFLSVRALAAGGEDALRRVRDWVDRRPVTDWLTLGDVELGPAVPDPGAIFAIGRNYGSPGEPTDARPARPLVYSKLPTSVAAHGAALTWDRGLTANVDAEVELGVVIGPDASVFGYTVVDDVSSRDPWLDGDQWLLGKSMPGFCPVGPWIVTADELDPGDLRLGCTINGAPIQDGRTASLRFSVGEIITFLGRHATLQPGDLIATGTPARLAAPPGPARHLEPGDRVTAWIDGIGELTTTIG